MKEDEREHMELLGHDTSYSPWGKHFIFYDFESMQEGEGEQVPNLVVAHSKCDKCEGMMHVTPTSTCMSCGSQCSICDRLNRKCNNFEGPPCQGCGMQEVIFSGKDTSRKFSEWSVSKQHKNMTVMAHNARAYDSYFVYNYLINHPIIPEIIFKESKIMYCKINNQLNIRMLDSLNFLPMALSQLPKSFGLEELKKGYFPHLYNAPKFEEDFNKVLPNLPDMHFYDVDNMRCGAWTKFM